MMSDCLDERPARCAICGREIDEGDSFATDESKIFVNPDTRTDPEDNAVIAEAVIIGACCEKQLDERAEQFDYTSMLALFGRPGSE